ncbi:MAG: HAD family hydrolase [Nocardioidaceae bacterium]
MGTRPLTPTSLIVDWGGVLTQRLDLAVRAWAAAEGIDFEHYRTAMRGWLAAAERLETAANPLHALERGELAVADFEARLVAEVRRLDGRPVVADGLIGRMFNTFEAVPAMHALVVRARQHGIRTALLSNSWGNTYPRDGWDEMFDVVVISGEVGLRKPEREIFDLTCTRLGVAAAGCVLVDDLEVNVTAAADLGMTAVLHRSYDETAARVQELFGLPPGPGLAAQEASSRSRPPQV